MASEQIGSFGSQPAFVKPFTRPIVAIGMNSSLTANIAPSICATTAKRYQGCRSQDLTPQHPHHHQLSESAASEGKTTMAAVQSSPRHHHSVQDPKDMTTSLSCMLTPALMAAKAAVCCRALNLSPRTAVPSMQVHEPASDRRSPFCLLHHLATASARSLVRP